MFNNNHPTERDLLWHIISQLSTLTALVTNIVATETQIMANLDGLTAQVAQTITVEQSAITLIQGLAAAIAAAGTDPTALQALQDNLLASSTALADAIAANPVPASN